MIYISFLINNPVVSVFTAFLGLCMGSFANVLIYRIPSGLSIISPRSFCPECKNNIKWFHNIPLASYLFLRGKCSYCRTEIPVQYPVIEILNSLLFLIILAYFKDFKLAAIYCCFTFILLVISIIDLKHTIIPDVLSIPLIIAGLILSPFNDMMGESVISRLVGSALGILAGAVLFAAISYFGKIYFKKEAMGEGDIKLIAAIGAFLGWKKVILTLFLGSLTGTILSIILIYAFKKKRWGDYIPFGPFLSIGAFLAVFMDIFI